jgi:hypothetical protein
MVRLPDKRKQLNLVALWRSFLFGMYLSAASHTCVSSQEAGWTKAKAMSGGESYKKEREIIHHLLSKKNITKYEIVEISGEGRELPGSTNEDEIETVSGTIVTATAVYGFWLDWIDGHYTLGEEKGNWHEFSVSDPAHDEDVLAALHRLQRKKYQ